MAPIWRLGKARKRGGKPAPRSERERLRDALSELRESEQQGDKRGERKSRHTDDYRELVINSGEGAGLSGALLELTRETYQNRGLPSEDSARLRLPHRRAGKESTDESSRREAERAARELGDEMKRLRIEPDSHYYRARERTETGEVDRTYKIETRKTPPGRPRRRRT